MNTNGILVDVHKLINRVQYLLDCYNAEDALKSIDKSGMDNEVIRNARGVCLLRLGHFDRAKWVFRDLVFPNGAFSIPEEIPTVLRTNYVTALLCEDNVGVAITQLSEIPDRQHPTVRQLWQQIRQWKRTIPWWRRMLFFLGLHAGKPFCLGIPPGQLWIPETTDTSRPREKAA
ncbi:MAG: hypothetical protein JW709_06000 [Sedimentisphaerales bacterium]|nr:hypothetical protein [Sedimentisphaerales bacterium]